MDLVIRRAIEEMDDGVYHKTTHGFSVHLRAQQLLITDMQSKCPRDTNRWAYFGKIIDWMLEKRRRLLVHVEQKCPSSTPSESWWIMTAAVAPMSSCCNTTLVTLQSRDMVLSQQRVEIANLIVRLCMMMGIEEVDVNNAYESLDAEEYCRSGRFWAPIAAVVVHVSDQGSWARDLLATLPDDEQSRVLREIGMFAVHLTDGLSGVQAERDGNNNSAVEESPFVMPADLVKLRTGRFIDTILDPFRSHVGRFWSDSDIEEIERDHRQLLIAYNDERALRDIIDGHDHTTMFNKAWDDLKGRFLTLRSFCGGLATAFANTTSVESDFSILKWEKDEHRSSMTNLSLEGIFQTKQHRVLVNIL
jgi:hypothetical protein